MENANKKIKYFLYARKSTESEDKQIQSIDDQINHLTKISNNLGLKIVEIFRESKSAKKPNNRPLFTKMMERIENGEATGILCWQINRLSRNPVDSGQINWLLQQGTIESIRTFEREYQPSDNVLLLSVESGMANQFLLDLSKNVTRGLRSKIEKGWYPCPSPLGYLNDKENHIIISDPKRFHLVRKMWDMMLTGNYLPEKILDIASNELGLTTIKKRKIGGTPLSRSGIYRIFTNPFYMGVMRYGGKEYPGKHEPMITVDEYDRVQMILGKKGKPRPQKHEFAYTGFIRCAECGCLYTATKKHKYVKSIGKVNNYVYYYCTRKKKHINCSQRKVLKKEDLEKQIEMELQRITILPEFTKWALDYLSKHNNQEIKDRKKIYESQHKALVKTQSELDELTKMRYKQLIDDNIFLREKGELQRKIEKLKKDLRSTENRAEKWLELTEKTFDFVTYARKAFITGDLQTKKEILHALGKNPTIKDGKLSINLNKWLQPIKESYSELEAEYKRLEPKEKSINKAQNEAFTLLRTRWYAVQDSNL